MDKEIALIIVGMAIVSYIPRALPLIALNKVEFPPTFVKWLNYIPVAVLAALLTPDLFVFQDQFNLHLAKAGLFAAVPTFVIAIFSRSMIWALLVGMGSYALFQFLF
ncbi:MAG: AzlD domain-containing protein [Bacillota bacterium]